MSNTNHRLFNSARKGYKPDSTDWAKDLKDDTTKDVYIITCNSCRCRFVGHQHRTQCAKCLPSDNLVGDEDF